MYKGVTLYSTTALLHIVDLALNLIWPFLKVDVVDKCDFFFFAFLNGVFILLDIISNSQAAS